MSLNLIDTITIMNGVSLAADATSTPVHILYTDNIGIQIVWTGTPTGTFGIQVSNTATLGTTGTISGGTWSTYTVTSPPAPAGSASNGIITLNQLPFAFVRLTYTAGYGTGTATAVLTAKPV